MTARYHSIEKGLSLKQPRVGFGKERIDQLMSNAMDYAALYGVDDTIKIVVSVLKSYCAFNLAHGHTDAHLLTRIEKLSNMKGGAESCELGQAGWLEETKESITRYSKVDIKNFFLKRYSIRNFAKEPVDLEDIKAAVVMAQKTPSVCNRQSSKVYVYGSGPTMVKALELQKGNKGFEDQIDKLLIVTSDVQHFIAVGERNQGWIDGGMFAMSLIYALHSLGLGTCCLNWSAEKDRDQKLRALTGIGPSECIIMMIAVGQLPSQLRVAASPRKRIQDVLIIK